jgi:hypothetical protein
MSQYPNLDFQNFYEETLSADLAAGAANVDVFLSNLPVPTEGFLVIDPESSSREIIWYDSLGTGKVICHASTGRGFDGTSAVFHPTGTKVIMAPIAEVMRLITNAGATLEANLTAGWLPLGDTPDLVTALGNGSYSLVFNGNDLTDTVSEGMRVRTARTVAASNTSFSLDGTNDYYVKTSPNKMTFTDDFAVGFWVYPTAYPGTFAGIASRYNGTSGWEFLMDSKGCVILIGHNAGSGNFRGVTSHQSLPLNEWTFVAAQLDMSAHTATTTTSYVMMNGLDVPAYVSQAGTNPTALVAAGNFEIGSVSGGTNPFTGYIGDGGVFSAKVTQATMLTYMNQPLVGTETNLASGYANGSVNDLNTTTPNNLTATNGATTVANAPYGNRGASTALDYGVVMSKAFSTNTTLTVRVPEGCTIPTSGGVSSVDYSTQDTPYGFPGISPIIASFSKLNDSTATTSDVAVAGGKVIIPVVPAGKSLRVTASCGNVASNSGATNTDMALWLGPVGSGVKITYGRHTSGGVNYVGTVTITKVFKPPTTTNVELNLSVSNIGGGTSSLSASVTNPLTFVVEIV